MTELATDMVTTRIDKGMTLKEISAFSHYSISALSQATSGQCIPTPGIIKAYAGALKVNPEPWLVLRARATEERRRNKKDGEQGDTGSVPASSGASSLSVEVPSSGRGRPSLPPAVAKRLPGHHRDTDSGEGPESDALDDTVAMRVQQLVTEAVEQVTPQLHGNPVANALSLCTVPGDLIELLNETRKRNEVTLRDIARRTPLGGVSISTTSLQKLLTSQDLPTVEVLRAVLIACRVRPEEIQFWLYHRARLELARERGAHRSASVKARPVRTVSYGSQVQVRLMATLPLVASMLTIIVMFFKR
ncbi:helix-turn-helix domain-containing protein [Streptomyces sp. NPDC086782]|uniref:helix-turn-helix domain-containing protein n=1 Tax=Streptomyces sp. NPDC086782 TaxID=3365757 RepID=UPI0037F39933